MRRASRRISASRRQRSPASPRPANFPRPQARTSGSTFPWRAVLKVGRQHTPVSGENQAAGNLSASSACPAAIRQEPRTKAADLSGRRVTEDPLRTGRPTARLDTH